MSQNGQAYKPRELARLLKVKENALFDGERGVVLRHIENQCGGFDREAIDKWVKMGAPTPSSLAGAAGRMDYTILERSTGMRSDTISEDYQLSSEEMEELRAMVHDVVHEVFHGKKTDDELLDYAAVRELAGEGMYLVSRWLDHFACSTDDGLRWKRADIDFVMQVTALT